MKRRHILHSLLLFLLFLRPLYLSAHPHMWIKGRLIPEIGPEGLESVHVIWDIDEMTSASLILDYDVNRNGVLEPKEITALGRGAFEHLIEAEYYLIVEIRNMRAMPCPATGFTASINSGHLIYDFHVPLEIPIRWNDLKDVTLYLFDQTYFIDFNLENTSNISSAYQNSTVYFKTVRRRMKTQGWGSISITGLGVTEVNK